MLSTYLDFGCPSPNRPPRITRGLNGVYQGLSVLGGITNPNNGVTAFSYDPDSNFTGLTDAKNNSTSYSYDSRDRVITRTDALGQVRQILLDANGNLTQYTDRRGTVDVFTYDGLNRRTFAGFGWKPTS